MSEQAKRVNERPPRVYLPWTRTEDHQLLEAYDQGKTLKDLAKDHRRSLGAIKSRLLHLNHRLQTGPKPDARQARPPA